MQHLVTGTTHVAASVCAALALSAPAEGIILAGIGGLLCDIDCSTSIIGKKIRFVSSMFEHRSFTHSLIFAMLCSLFNVWLALGVLTHILLDMMTPAGVRLFWPIKKKLHFPLAGLNSSNSLFEKILQFIFIAFCVCLAVSQSTLGAIQITAFFEEFISGLREIYGGK